MNIISTINGIEGIEIFFKLCDESDSNNLYFFPQKNIPKISIVSPVYNRGEYLLRFLKSIHNQNFNDIEIILIDDCSSDSTFNLIKSFQKIDKRIILIRNKKNFGTFKSRNIGILASKGDYAILPDPDDILSKNCLKKFFVFATKYNYEMLRFNLYIGNNTIFVSNLIKNIKSRPVFPPEIQTFLYYATGIMMYIDFNVSNKFIKRQALIRALNLLGKKYLYMYMNTCEDQLLNYILYRTVKSFYFLKIIGYYYITNPKSITTRQFGSNNIKNIFINLKIIFDYSKNDLFEKNMFNDFFNEFVIGKSILNKTEMVKEDAKFYIDAINIFIQNDFISINNKEYMIQLKEKLVQVY